MQRSFKHTSISSLALGAVLGTALLTVPQQAEAARAQGVSGQTVSSTFDGSDPNICRTTSGRFFVSYQTNDIVGAPGIFADYFLPAIADSAGNIVGQGNRSSVGRSGNPFSFTIDLPVAASYTGAPLNVGIIDTPRSGTTGPFKAANYPLPLTDMVTAGGSCAVIAAPLLPNTPPTADAGPDQTVAAVFNGAGNVTVTLNGAASSDPDPFDSTLNFSWAQISGPTVTLAAGSTVTDAMPVYEQPSQAGTSIFELTVTDSRGATSTDQVSVNWNNNSAPTANAGPDQTVRSDFDGTGTANVTLDASASTDPDQSGGLTYSWSQVSGPVLSLVTGASATDAMPVYGQPSQAASTVFEVTVTDSLGATSTDTVTVFWRERNRAPIADAGPNRVIADIVSRTTPITLDGSASSDPDNDALTYTWQVSGPDGQGVQPFNGLNNPSSTVDFTFNFDYANSGLLPQTAEVTFTLIVNDGQVDSVADQVTYTLNRRNLAPSLSLIQTSPADGGTVTLTNASTNIRAQAFAQDPENAPLTYQWEQKTPDPRSGFNFLSGVQTNDDDLRLNFTSNALPFAQPQLYEFEVIVSDGTNVVKETYDFTGLPQTSVNRLTVEADAARADRFSSENSGCYVETSVIVTGYENEILSGFANNDQYARRLRTDGGNILFTQDGAASIGVSQGETFGQIISSRNFSSLNAFDNIVFEWLDKRQGRNGPVVYSKSIPITSLPSTGTCGQLQSTKNAMSGNTVPVADAGANQSLTVSSGDLVTLDATASTDADGDTLSYRWTQLSGTSVTLSDANAARPTFAYVPPAGQSETLSFQLTVDDGTNTAVDIVEIALTRANAAPTANAGPDQSVRNVDASSVVTLDGSASSDLDGDPLTYRWTQISGTPVTLSDASAAMPSFTGVTPSAAETLVFELVVNDGSLSSTADTVSIALSPTTNFPPVADVVGPTAPIRLDGDPNTVQTVTLNGRSSSDPDGDSLTYQWVQLSGAETLQLAAGTSLTDDLIQLEAPSTAGVYSFELTVNDGTETATTSVQFEFTPPNTAPVADAGANQALTVAANTVITLDGSGSTDSDGDPITYQWTQTGGTPVTLSDPATASPTFSYLPSAVETLTFELVVNDGITNSVSDAVSIELTPGVTTGTINQLQINDGQVCNIVANATFTGFSDDGSNLDSFRLALTDNGTPPLVIAQRDNSESQGRSLTTDYDLLLNYNGLGIPDLPLSVSLLDIDASGAVISTLATTPVDLDSVAAAGPVCRAAVKDVRGNQIPIANAGPDQTINNVNSSTTVQLDASASTDADSDALTYRWVQTAGPAVTLINSTSATPSFMFVPAMMDTISFDVFVSDGTDESQADSVTIKLNRANVLPVAEAGANQALRTARPGASQTPQQLTLDGTASSDSDGDALTYAWSQVSGPTLNLASGSSLTDASPIFEGPAQEGTVVFELVVNDGFGNSAPDTVEAVYTFFDNEAPTADAGPDQTVDQAVGIVSVSLAGSGTDPENTALSYTWTQTSGPSVTLDNASSATPSFSFDMSGQTTDVVFGFELVTSDGALSSAADPVTVTLTPNAVPVADAGADQSVSGLVAATVVQLDGSASTDGDGDTLSYAWTQVSGPSVILDDASSATPSFSFDPGTDTSALSFVFDLVVSDGRVTSAPDRITVNALPNNAPTADAGAPVVQTAYVVGTAVELDGRSSSDPNGDRLQYSWVQLSGPSVTLDDPTSPTPSFTYEPNAGTSGGGLTPVKGGATVSQMPGTPIAFIFGLTVTDGVLQSPQSEVRVELTVNDPPEADAGEDQTLETPADGTTITLDGSGSFDPEGDALTYSWVQTSGRTITLSDATAISPTFTYDYPNPLPAEESFTFALTLNDGNQDSVADEVTITVINNQAPTANAGADIGPINAGQIVTLNGGASTDPDDDTLTYVWNQVSGPTVTLDDATSATPSFTAPDVEDLSTLIFELVVNDGRVDSAADRVSVTVQPVGSIRIVQRVTGADGAFAYTSTVAALNASITTQGGQGSLTADRIGTGVYTITARDERDRGYALTDLFCSDNDSTTNLVARTATIALAPGEDVVCTFEVVNSREAATKAIRTALVARSQLLLAAEPDMQRRIDRLNGTTQSASGVQIAGLTVPGSDKMGITARVSEREVNVSGSLLASNTSGVLAGQFDGLTENGKFDVWGEASLMEFDFQGTNGDLSVIYLGADYLVSETVLVGGMIQLDDFDFGHDGETGAVNGTGFMAGPYATAKFGENFYVDARAAWGSSDNEVNPLGVFSDEFDTSRALYAGTVAGEWTFKNKLNVRPALSVKYLMENQKAYTDALGVVIPEQSVDLGEFAFGPRLSKPWKVGANWTLTPFGEVKGVYNFGDAAKDILQDDTRIRLSWGADMSSLSGVRVGLSGFNDGIGSEDLESFGIRASLAYTFK